MKNNKLLGLLGLSLAIVGCDTKVTEMVYTDPATAPAVSVDNSAAETIIENAEEKTQIQLKEIAAANLIGIDVEGSIDGDASIKITTKTVPGFMEAATSTINTAANANFKLQANIDVDGLKKYDEQKETHADISKTELYAQANVNAQIVNPDDETQNSKYNAEFKGAIKNGKVTAYEKEGQEEGEWDVDEADAEESDSFANAILTILDTFNPTSVSEAEQAEFAEYAEVATKVIEKFDQFMDGKITADEFVAYIDGESLMAGQIARSQATSTVVNVLNQVKALDLDSIVSYTTQGNADAGYIVNIAFDYVAFKTALNSFITGLKTDENIGSMITSYESVINSLLPTELNASLSVTIAKSGMVEGIGGEFKIKGSMAETGLSVLAALVDEDYSSMFAYYSSVEYDANAKFNLSAKLGTNKVTVETLEAPTQA